MKTTIKTLIILLIFSQIAIADYHYASHEGSNEYPYTSWETAADSIQKAITASEPSDTVYVGEGVFYENIDLTDTLAIIGMGWENTKVHSTDKIIYGGEGAVFKGFWIEGEDGIHDWGITLGASPGSRYMIVEDCKITNCQTGIWGWAGGIYRNNIIMDNEYGINLPGYDPVIENNTIIDNQDEGIYGGFSSPTIKNNFMARNGLGAISYSQLYGRAEIYNNIFYDNGLNTRTGAQVGIVYGKSLIYNNYFGMSEIKETCLGFSEGIGVDSVINNIFSKGRYGLWIGYSFVFVLYNDFYDNEEDIHLFYGEDSLIGNIYTNPMVTSEDDGFRLQAFSPCIDAGHPDLLDVDSSRSDIGAYGGPYGTSYVYEDYPPEPPDSLQFTFQRPDTIHIGWIQATEADFNHYNIYRSTNSGFPSSPEYLIAESDTFFYKDTDWNREHNYYYLITSIDNQGLESQPSDELAVIFTSVTEGNDDFLPHHVELKQNYPNPFNPETTISYYIPPIGAQPAEVKIEIYNIRGEIVKTLVDDYQYPGHHRIAWGGTDDNGDKLSSGIYFYNLKMWNTAFTHARKMVLVK
ncbi:MAG: hypothetical protein GY855_04185 [candidate division Zixibacteria bacterium]|nr:hypothetical protein [candidate division Zixibacteria bacterium]